MVPNIPMYHGTSLANARIIVGPPITLDVTRGSGEFGQGIYFGGSKGFAMSWASNRSSKPGLVVASPDKDEIYKALKVMECDQKESDKLRASVGRKKGAYLTGSDLVVGTIKNNPRKLQYKFESSNAQTFLHTKGNLGITT